jgi:uncharacterized protein YndB with AHSA1/START domain
MVKEKSRVSDGAVKKATGKNWKEWKEILDNESANKMTHKEIARLLLDKGYIKNGWWAQTVTVEYERMCGRRAVGQTQTAGFEIGVQKTISISPEQAWNLLTKPPGRDIWLGTVPKIQFRQGEVYETTEETNGQIRGVMQGKRLRLTWHPKNWENHSTLQITIVPSGKNTSIRFHQEKLAGKKEREEMRNH